DARRGFSAELVVARRWHRVVSACGRVLAASGGPAAARAKSGGARAARRHAVAAAVSPLHALVVHAGLAGVHRGDRYVLADDGQACLVVSLTKFNSAQRRER